MSIRQATEKHPVTEPGEQLEQCMLLDIEPFQAPICPQELDGLTLYENDAKLIERLPALMESWRRAHPGVDLAAEIAKAHAWEQANRKRKNHIRYLNRWMNNIKRFVPAPCPADIESFQGISYNAGNVIEE